MKSFRYFQATIAIPEFFVRSPIDDLEDKTARADT
jgi:hypothetical protein